MPAVIQSGVNHVFNVRFRAVNIRKYRDQVREMAVAAAREKATALAAKLDQRIGKAFSIDEDDPQNNPSPIGRMYLNNSVAEASSGGGESAESSLMLGQIAIQARVRVRFELQ